MTYVLTKGTPIERTKAIVEAMAERWGQPLELGGDVRYTFPSAKTLLQVGPTGLSNLTPRFRFPKKQSATIIEIAQRVTTGDLDWRALSESSYSYVIGRLMATKGVGYKVANCVTLMALEKPEAFPVDVWVNRAMDRWYQGDYPTPRRPDYPSPRDHDAVIEWATDRFGSYAGHAGQYLFHGIEPNKGETKGFADAGTYKELRAFTTDRRRDQLVTRISSRESQSSLSEVWCPQGRGLPGSKRLPLRERAQHPRIARENLIEWRLAGVPTYREDHNEMDTIDGQIQFSANDLVNHLACRRLTELNNEVASGLRFAPSGWDPTLALLRERGLAHERAYIEYLKDQGEQVTIIAGVGVDDSSVADTVAAMCAGDQVICQAALRHGRFAGRADILRRVDEPSALGGWSYEVTDTKLARDTRSGTILQLSLYSDLVGVLQDKLPELMYVVAPWTEGSVPSIGVKARHPF